MHVIGIDVGLKGGLALHDGSKLLHVVCMPLISGEMHPSALIKVLTGWHKIDHVFIEHSQAFPKMVGKSSVFNFAMGFGMLIGVVGALSIPYTLVKPKAWQKEMHKGAPQDDDPKKRSAYAAYSLFPNISFKASDRCKNDHDGMIDAALIAAYGARLIGRGSDNIQEQNQRTLDSHIPAH